MNIRKTTKVYTAFLFLDHKFWKEKIEDRVKLLELNFFKQLLSKDDNDRFV